MHSSWALPFIFLFVPTLADLSGLGDMDLDMFGGGSGKRLPDCKLCTTLVDSFTKLMEKTAKDGHDGGDSVWEKKLKSYGESEIRLTVIQESLCKDVYSNRYQCHKLAADAEHLIEEWFLERQAEHPDMHKWLCIEQTTVCCAKGHYGSDCLPCTDCHGNGKCKGDGTRKGNGKCKCNAGYTGETCMECSTGYYESFRDETKLLCTACHDACDKEAGCTGAGPKACKACKEGWLMQPEEGGCVDIDECAENKANCTKNQFCVNNEGSFSCLECDKSCNGCTGDGPDLCNECAEGFELRDGLCTAIKDEEDEEEEEVEDGVEEEIENKEPEDGEIEKKEPEDGDKAEDSSEKKTDAETGDEIVPETNEESEAKIETVNTEESVVENADDDAQVSDDAEADEEVKKDEL